MTRYALRTKLRNMIGTPFGKPPSPAMIIEANEAFAMIADQNDDGPPGRVNTFETT